MQILNVCRRFTHTKIDTQTHARARSLASIRLQSDPDKVVAEALNDTLYFFLNIHFPLKTSN